jgi:hypothetical protein
MGTGLSVILHRETGEGDRRRRQRGRREAPLCVAAPSTMLRMVPLPRCAVEDPRTAGTWSYVSFTLYCATGRRARSWIRRPGLALETTGEVIWLSALAQPVKRLVLYW